MSGPDQSEGGGAWTLLTGHGHVLVEITRNPGARIRDISPVVGLTDRSVQAIVADLEAAGYLTRTRTGRRVVYTEPPALPRTVTPLVSLVPGGTRWVQRGGSSRSSTRRMRFSSIRTQA